MALPMRNPRHLVAVPSLGPLAAGIAAVFGLTLSLANAGALPRAFDRPPQRATPSQPPDLTFSGLARALRPSGTSPHHPSATLHHVTSCNDNPNDAGSLRSIIASPNTFTGDAIDFVQLPMVCSTITLSQGQAIVIHQDT